ncbi:response regulator transcription factor [Ideonella livida]|uniref:Response regulator transcription factor n=1 Tax=Ideonella livida TaxID=2707176 RepID=A0A7C9PJ03_9BURK|nr:response regulator transcription factor [Ideonella livida]NDY93008.1 response regulator transcription factor [Ideonella livida]
MRLLLVDDHTLFREGMRLLLQPLVQPLEVEEAGSCEEALARFEAGEAFDLVLMDLALPGASGIQGMAWLKAARPEVKVVALSSSDDRDSVLRALDAGAMGFIPKSSTGLVMLAALQLVLARGIYLPPSVFLPGGVAAPVELRPTGADATGSAGAADRADPGPGTDGPAVAARLGLSPRQAEVLDLLLQGKSAKLIARDLDLGLATVKTHTTAVLRALNVTTRTQAIVAASRLGWRFSR